MEAFLSDYTENEAADIYYNSRQQQIDDFNDFYRTFLVLGISLSFIIGMVGVLNFLNSIVTGILARRREFAVLQSVGMTGGQLKGMLIMEGLFYAVGSVMLALLIFFGGKSGCISGYKTDFSVYGLSFYGCANSDNITGFCGAGCYRADGSLQSRSEKVCGGAASGDGVG